MDINMTFGSTVEFMIKWAFASVIALIFVGALCALPFDCTTRCRHDNWEALMKKETWEKRQRKLEIREASEETSDSTKSQDRATAHPE